MQTHLFIFFQFQHLHVVLCTCSLYSALLVSMDFKFEETYLVEGHKPFCIQIEARYYMENDHQQYLWPVKIFVKGSLTGCGSDSDSEKYFLPVTNIGFFVTTAVITVGVCLVGFVFHSIRLLTFLKVGKVCLYHTYLYRIG